MTVPGNGQEPNPQAGQEPSGSTPSGQSQQQTPPPAASGQEPSPERFDAEYVKELRRSEAATRKRLQEAEAKVKEFEQAQLSETERLTAQLADANAKASSLEAKYQTALIRSAVEREAAKAGAVDPEVVYALIDRDGVKLDENGAVSGADKAVKALLDAKPYLRAAEGAPPPAASKSVPATPKPTGAGATRDEQVKRAQQELAGTGRYRL